ncbi:lantibiotic dehydratase [Chitinophaga arvensicola]|uniref:Thiopeptide-type bacteriocin biosynthesis domain-containing protein n=1 Tax=Chitinophaga arvensicola TaxID=29529 RepID=A0A1I0QW87_9BACT|nr:lantibiotic dehydratase [Chitinophaga arvensicola]SEW31982.1 thiopeptide-type bacteriocin biosynthesis domain-containing protein [Chitinophaga arvensicola]
MRIVMSLLSTCDFFLLRMPLLSFEEVLRMHRSAHNDQDSFVAAIRRLYSSPLLQEAVFLASPALHAQMMKWLSSSDLSLKLPLALYRYFLRMSTRCTPYGLFAGCVTGRIVPGATQLPVPGEHPYQPVARLDMEYLSELINELVQRPEIGKQLTFYPNNSLYTAGTTWRYFEYQLREKKRHYFLSAFSRDTYLDALLTAATNGATLSSLTTLLTRKGVSGEEADTFLDTLIRNQILVAGLSAEITGIDQLEQLIRSLTALDPAPAFIPALQQIRQLLMSDSRGVTRYQEIQKILMTHFPEIVVKDPVQVDLFFMPGTTHLSAAVTDLLLRRLERLSVLGDAGASADLRQFKTRFIQQYDQREVPLMMALDSESGIGYGVVSGDHASYTPLIDDLVMPTHQENGTVNWNVQTKFILKHFLASRSSGATVISLTDEDLDDLAEDGHTPAMPSSLGLMGSLLAASASSLDKGEFQFLLKACNGPNALSLLGRFATGQEELEKLLRDFAREEQVVEKDRILAEIVHLPEGRTGNVLLRPSLYEYEIPFLGKSSLPQEKQLPVSDLWISVRNGRVILRSRQLGKEVLPRLTSAHNFIRGLAVYKFLCDLQQQDALSIQWNWGILLDQPFLPRVVYQEIILARARWRLSHSRFESLLASHTPDAALLRLKEECQLPDDVLLSEGDNDLLIDFTSVFARMLLTDKLKKGSVILYENLFSSATRLPGTEQGAFCNEIILPLRNTRWQPPAAVEEQPETLPLPRSFVPGSEWLYAKIYCGFKWMDKLLLKELLPLTASLQSSGITDSWFFIRYQDPEPHIRIRFHLPQYQAHSQVVIQQLQDILAPYLRNDIVQKLQFDTYIRELERYGAVLMEYSEAFFFHDSEAVLRLLQTIGGGETEERWLIALKGADELLNGFGYTPLMKSRLLEELQQQFFKEHHGNAALMLQLNNKYRLYSRKIAAVLSDNVYNYTLSDSTEIRRSAYGSAAFYTGTPGALPVEVREIFGARAGALEKVIRELRLIQPDAVTRLPPHYLHMFLNRMFTANARLQELVIYHYLMKYYASVVARG